MSRIISSGTFVQHVNWGAKQRPFYYVCYRFLKTAILAVLSGAILDYHDFHI